MGSFLHDQSDTIIPQSIQSSTMVRLIMCLRRPGRAAYGLRLLQVVFLLASFSTGVLPPSRSFQLLKMSRGRALHGFSARRQHTNPANTLVSMAPRVRRGVNKSPPSAGCKRFSSGGSRRNGADEEVHDDDQHRLHPPQQHAEPRQQQDPRCSPVWQLLSDRALRHRLSRLTVHCLLACAHGEGHVHTGYYSERFEKDVATQAARGRLRRGEDGEALVGTTEADGEALVARALRQHELQLEHDLARLAEEIWGVNKHVVWEQIWSLEDTKGMSRNFLQDAERAMWGGMASYVGTGRREGGGGRRVLNELEERDA